MKAITSAALILFAGTALSAQEERFLEGEARQRAAEARLACAARVEHLDGVVSVNMGGTGKSYRLFILVRDAAAKARVQEKIGGDRFRGLDIHWSFAAAARKPAGPALRNTGPVNYMMGMAPSPRKSAPVNSMMGAPLRQTRALPRNDVKAFQPQQDEGENFWKAKVTDCDIVRNHLKMKRISHPIGNGRYYKPCQLMLRSVTGAGGGHSFYYTKHRPDCPIRLGRVGQPSWADHHIAWIFQKGFTQPIRGGITWPYELRASDSLWRRQMVQDVKSRLPRIRDGAEWVWTGYGWYWRTASRYYPYGGY